MYSTTFYYGDLEFDIEYKYHKEEQQIYNYGDGSGYAGYPAHVEVFNIFLNTTEVTDIITTDLYNDICDFVLENHDE